MFQLTDQQRASREAAREITETEIRPRARELDQQGTYPEAILDEIGDARLSGITLSEEYGGLGRGLVDWALVTEEFASSLLSVASALSVHLTTATMIERFGSERQRDRYLADMATFDTVGAHGVTESGAGNDKRAMETRAEKSEAQSASERSGADRSSADRSSGQRGGSMASNGTSSPSPGPREDGATAEADGDEWVIDGHKRWVTNFEEADVMTVFAKTGSESDDRDRITAFLVSTDRAEVEKRWDTLGINCVQPCQVRFDGVRVSDAQILGEPHEGLEQLSTVNVGAVNYAARGVGVARGALESAKAYVQDRRQFDQPIADFQGVRWKVADMATRTDEARLLVHRAAATADADEPSAGKHLSMAKVRASEVAEKNASEAVQVHGGVGYTTEYDPERHYRDAKLLTLGGGANEVHRNTVADAVFSE